MARKTRLITISAEGRDQGKTFLLTEMAAVPAEKWAARAILALGKSGVDVPDEFRQRGMDAIVTVGLRAFVGIEFADAEPLMDEMMACARFVPDQKIPDITRAIFDGDVEEVETLLRLRGELMELHTGFTVRAGLWTLGTKLAEWIAFHLTQISPRSSEPSSEADEQAGLSSAPLSG